MKVYIVVENSFDENIVDRVFKTRELAEAYLRELDNKKSYDIEEYEVEEYITGIDLAEGQDHIVEQWYADGKVVETYIDGVEQV